MITTASARRLARVAAHRSRALPPRDRLALISHVRLFCVMRYQFRNGAEAVRQDLGDAAVLQGMSAIRCGVISIANAVKSNDSLHRERYVKKFNRTLTKGAAKIAAVSAELKRLSEAAESRRIGAGTLV